MTEDKIFTYSPSDFAFTANCHHCFYNKYVNKIENIINEYKRTDGFEDKDEYKDYLFLPFTDLTNGDTTYGGGRYIDMRIPEKNTIILDFNQSYNPYCAYGGNYSCPIPPAENNLDIAITAGVKKFKAH